MEILQYLTFSNLTLLLFLYITVSFISQIIYHRYLSPLSHIPGPFFASTTRLWLAYHCLLGDECDYTLALHRKHGPVLRISPTMVSVSDGSKIPEIYTRKTNKSAFYIAGAFGKEETVFNMQDHHQHAHYRKYLAGPYGMGSVRKMEGLIDSFVTSWTEKLGTTFATPKGGKFDFAPWATFLAYDVIASIGFGGPFGFIEQGKDIGNLIREVENGLPLLGMAARLYPFTKWCISSPLLGRFLIPSPRDKSGFGSIMRFRDVLYAQRLDDLKEGRIEKARVDLLQTLLDARTEDGEPLTTEYIKVETLLVLLAGAETTGTAFQGLVVMVMKTPGVYEKLMAEIDQVTKEGKVSSPPKYDETVAHCPYYVACLKEALRVYSPVDNQLPRVAGPDGLNIGGYHIPQGAEVACNPWVIHRDTAIFGEDAEIYRPERWLESEEKRKFLDRHILTFGSGTRICLGKDIAMMELYKGPFEFFRTFKPKFVDERSLEWAVKGGVGVWKDLWMTIEKREK